MPDTAVKLPDTAGIVGRPNLATRMRTTKGKTIGHAAEIFGPAQAGLSAVQSQMRCPVSLVDGTGAHNTPFSGSHLFSSTLTCSFQIRL